MSKNKNFSPLILEDASEYIQSLDEANQGTIYADIEAMKEGDFDSVYTKQLRGKIRELIVGNHRITYFLIKSYIYFVRGFMKKTGKTPKKEIEYAEKIFKLVNKK